MAINQRPLNSNHYKFRRSTIRMKYSTLRKSVCHVKELTGSQEPNEKATLIKVAFSIFKY
jgi:hypothetical protein